MSRQRNSIGDGAATRGLKDHEIAQLVAVLDRGLTNWCHNRYFHPGDQFRTVISELVRTYLDSNNLRPDA